MPAKPNGFIRCRDLRLGSNSFAVSAGSVANAVQRSGGKKGLGAGPVADVEGRAGVGTGRGRTRSVMLAEGMFDDAAAHRIHGRDAAFGIDEKLLPTEGAADPGGELRWLASVHR
jgi:hypothetical protein